MLVPGHGLLFGGREGSGGGSGLIFCQAGTLPSPIVRLKKLIEVPDGSQGHSAPGQRLGPRQKDRKISRTQENRAKQENKCLGADLDYQANSVVDARSAKEAAEQKARLHASRCISLCH